MAKFLNISTDNTLGGITPSDIKVVSEKAIKDYIDNNTGSSLPDQTGHSGEFLSTNGSTASWSKVQGTIIYRDWTGA